MVKSGSWNSLPYVSSNFPFLLFNCSSLPESSEEREVEEGDCRGVSSGDVAMELLVEEEVEMRSSELWTKLLRAVMADMAAVAASFGKVEVNIEDSCEYFVGDFQQWVVGLLEKASHFPIVGTVGSQRSETRGSRSLPAYTIDLSG